MITIKGEVRFQKLATGFWGIIGEDGQQWRPSELPEAFQKEGLKVKVTAQKAAPTFSIFMWGTAIDIEHIELMDT